MFTKAKFILSYVFTGNVDTTKKMKVYLPKCIQVTLNLGFYLRMVVSDQGPTNRALYSYLYIKGFEIDSYKFRETNCIGLDGSYQIKLSSILSKKLNEIPFAAKYGDCYLPLIYDYCHLFKSFRNVLRNYDLNTLDGLVSFSIYEAVYNYDFNRVVRICPKLTKEHIYPNGFQKMSVRLAVQLFSNSMAAAIQTLLPLNVFKDKDIARSTLKFTRKLNKLYDILNGRFNLRIDSEEYEFLVEMMEYFQNIKPVTLKTVRIYCFDGIVLTIKGILALAIEIMPSVKTNNLSLKVFNQDDCENTFSKIRGRNGFKQNPSSNEIRSIMGRIMSIDLIYNTPSANCEQTESENISIDWKTALDGDLVELPEAEPEPNFKPEVKEFRSSEDVAIRYYAGYCIFKLMKNTSCDNCKALMVKDSSTFDHPSEALIFSKNYDENSDFGSLFPPSNLFFEICKLQVNNY